MLAVPCFFLFNYNGGSIMVQEAFRGALGGAAAEEEARWHPRP